MSDVVFAYWMEGGDDAIFIFSRGWWGREGPLNPRWRRHLNAIMILNFLLVGTEES